MEIFYTIEATSSGCGFFTQTLIKKLEILVEIILLAGTILFIGYPLFSPNYKGAIVKGQFNDNFNRLLSKKDMVYTAIKDIDFDFKTGKLSEEDYNNLKSQYQSEAIEVLEQIDNFGKTDKKKIPNNNKSSNLFCTKCGNKINERDKFCSGCGNKI